MLPKIAALGLALSTLYCTLVCAQTPATRFTLLRVGKLYDSDTRTFLKDQQILIQNDLIRDVGVKLAVPKGTTIIDLAHCTLTPGLIDAHTHLLIEQKTQTETGFQEAAKLPAQQRIEQGLTIAKQHLQAGITTVRDVGNSGQYLDIRLQKLLLANKALGPSLYASGPIMSPPGGQFGKLFPADSFIIDQEYRVIRGAADARTAVLDHIKQGVNVIKVCMNTDNRVLAPEEIKAIVLTAHAHQIPVTAHATYDESARDAVLAGVDGIEHGYSLSDSTLSLMAERKVYLVPTDVSIHKGKLLVAGIGMKGKEADDYLTTNLNAFHDRLRRAVKKGIMIVSGSDYYNFIKGIERGNGATDVLLAYHEAGIPVPDVLGFATTNAAKALGISPTYGSLRKGSKANLVAFQGDLEGNFAEVLFSVRAVFHEGQLVYESAKK
ncbi:amidohydrolase family protein [Spirosoma migulaei]